MQDLHTNIGDEVDKQDLLQPNDTSTLQNLHKIEEGCA